MIATHARSKHAKGTGFTIIELLVALAMMAALMAAVAAAVKASMDSYRDNERFAEATQMARFVLDRMMREVRTADAVESTSATLSIIPPAGGPDLIQYALGTGVLYYRQTVDGSTTSQVLIASDETVTLLSMTITRKLGPDPDPPPEDPDATCTESVTVRLVLAAGNQQIDVTASACPRRNRTF